VQIIFNKTFEKQYSKLSPILQRKVDIAIEKFEVNPYDISLMNHNLTGKLIGYKSIRVNYNIRIVFTEEGGYTLVQMIQIGTHDEVYR
jgi:mRNA-degrading endonuclease YafQ of YafQ-DinJ toxin-antitoxin module